MIPRTADAAATVETFVLALVWSDESRCTAEVGIR